MTTSEKVFLVEKLSSALPKHHADNIIIGNVAFYGATAGKAYISGVAAER